jgi:hypothetical protein
VEDVITLAVVGSALRAVQMGPSRPTFCPECGDDEGAVVSKFVLVDFDELALKATVVVLTCRVHGPLLVVHGPAPR